MTSSKLCQRSDLEHPVQSLWETRHHLSIHAISKPLDVSINQGRLRLRAVIAKGGSSVLFKGHDVNDGRDYAVKCMPRGAKSSDTYARHARERTLQQRVDDHPNIVTLHRAFAQGEHAFFVYDLYTGGDLYSAIERRLFVGRDNLVRNIFLQLCDAVAHCHTRGVYHLDIKPENILCDKRASRVALSDFGLATTDRDCRSRPPGSKAYSPPECFRHDREGEPTIPTAVSDVWALGVILVNLITTVNPWHAASIQDPKFASYAHDPQSYFAPLRLPVNVEALILRALAIDPYERISTAEIRDTARNIRVFFPVKGYGE
ncbi:unnamed protein product [Peniophora sp. CBMAI 1063]|nr:unnamed protein product [Peniophora sp. CBMAI 1063]